MHYWHLIRFIFLCILTRYAYNEEDNRNAVPLNQVTRPTICDPNKGIKTGDRLIIRFLDSTM
jgi:hypothetical protein